MDDDGHRKYARCDVALRASCVHVRAERVPGVRILYHVGMLENTV